MGVSKYCYLVVSSERAELIAIEYYKKGDEKMATFWKNAAIGYKNKSRTLTIKEGNKDYDAK